MPPSGALRCDLLYHGTLALRGPGSAQGLTAIRAGGAGQVFLDVNLRDPWWSREQVLGMVKAADRVKLNRDELDLEQLGLGSGAPKSATLGPLPRARKLAANERE